MTEIKPTEEKYEGGDDRPIPEAPQGYRLVEIDQATEKRVIRKLDRVVVTFMFLLC